MSFFPQQKEYVSKFWRACFCPHKSQLSSLLVLLLGNLTTKNITDNYTFLVILPDFGEQILKLTLFVMYKPSVISFVLHILNVF